MSQTIELHEKCSATFVNLPTRQVDSQMKSALQQATDQAAILRNELTHANRLELIGNLTMSIVHDVNQPLCAIASNAQMAIDLLGVGQIEEARNALKDIRADARRGSEVIGRIRSMVKQDAPSRSPVGFASVIEELALHEENQRLAQLVGSLTPRERRILFLVADGMPNKVIAARLGVCLQTVKLHRGHVMHKLHLHSVADLVRLAEKAKAQISRP